MSAVAPYGAPGLYHLTILGCGSSDGVPRIGGNWGQCDPTNPKNRRRRCALLVQRFSEAGDVTSVLVDTPPDIRSQLLDAEIGWLDAVVYTHEHADHTHGIDDLRVVAANGRQRVKVYADTATAQVLRDRFGYCFETPTGSAYPPILELHRIDAGERITIDGPGGPVTLIGFDQIHGRIRALGFRIGAAAYSSDVNDFPDVSLHYLDGLELWIIDALRRAPHVTHFNLDDALRWIERMNPNRAVLTNMHNDLDYETVRAETPNHVEPAYDMMRLTTPITEIAVLENAEPSL